MKSNKMERCLLCFKHVYSIFSTNVKTKLNCIHTTKVKMTITTSEQSTLASLLWRNMLNNRQRMQGGPASMQHGAYNL